MFVLPLLSQFFRGFLLFSAAQVSQSVPGTAIRNPLVTSLILRSSNAIMRGILAE
jgi:hypothetical protein